MSEGPMPKEILVLSDSQVLSQVIKLVVGSEFTVNLCGAGAPQGGPAPDGVEGIALVIVALSAYSSEPIVALAQAGLVDRVGQIPFLIISSKPFSPDADHRISHLDYPFSVDDLKHQVDRIMYGAR